MTENDSIHKEIFISVPAEQLFPFLVDAERMVKWMGTMAELDARPGGLFRLHAGGDRVAGGEFVEVEPNRRVVFTWGWEGAEGFGPGSTTVEITLEERDGGTVLTLRHSGLSGAAREQHARTWERCLANLRELVERRSPE